MHHGVVLPSGEVLHNTPLEGEHRSSEEEFRKGRRMYVAGHIEPMNHWRLRSVDEDPASPRPYNPLTNNCEHTVTRVTEGVAYSPQLQDRLASIVVGGLVFAITRKPSMAVAGYTASRMVLRRWRQYRRLGRNVPRWAEDVVGQKRFR